MTIQSMAKTDNKEKHYFQGLEASSDSFVQVNKKRSERKKESFNQNSGIKSLVAEDIS